MGLSEKRRSKFQWMLIHFLHIIVYSIHFSSNLNGLAHGFVQSAPTNGMTKATAPSLILKHVRNCRHFWVSRNDQKCGWWFPVSYTSGNKKTLNKAQICQTIRSSKVSRDLALACSRAPIMRPMRTQENTTNMYQNTDALSVLPCAQTNTSLPYAKKKCLSSEARWNMMNTCRSFWSKNWPHKFATASAFVSASSMWQCRTANSNGFVVTTILCQSPFKPCRFQSIFRSGIFTVLIHNVCSIRQFSWCKGQGFACRTHTV